MLKSNAIKYCKEIWKKKKEIRKHTVFFFDFPHYYPLGYSVTWKWSTDTVDAFQFGIKDCIINPLNPKYKNFENTVISYLKRYRMLR